MSFFQKSNVLRFALIVFLAISFGLLAMQTTSQASGPRLSVSYSLDSEIGTYRFPLEPVPTDECVGWSEPRENFPEMTDYEFNEIFCQEYEHIEDVFSPELREISYEITMFVRNMPPGWQICYSIEDEDQRHLISRSINQYYSYFLSSTSFSDQFDYMGGEGGDEVTPTSITSFASGMYVDTRNTFRPVLYPRVAICGPDITRPGGFGWRLLEGKSIKLPPLNRW